MKFTYNGYEELLNLLDENGYKIADYHTWKEFDKCVVLRHDVDTDLQKALEMAELEYQRGIKSTYFVLVTSNFYNLHSCRNRQIVNEIQNLGHTVGLHFDEMSTPEDIGNVGKVIEHIENEIKVLTEILNTSITAFSYHRPSKTILDADIMIQGVVNAYGNLFFKQFKYMSDSRMHWREPVLNIIREGKYQQLHILTHPLWYHNEEKTMKEILYEFLSRASMEKYDNLKDNFTNLSDVINWREFE